MQAVVRGNRRMTAVLEHEIAVDIVETGMPSHLARPTALQIVGHRFDDSTVLRIGAAVEATRPWAERRPNI